MRRNSCDPYILKCYFFNLHSTSSGGALLYSQQNSSILIEYCLFLNCSSTSYSGALRILGSNCVIAFTCGNECKAGENDAFCAIGEGTYRNINSFFDFLQS